MKKIIHRLSAIIATLCIALFFSATLYTELFLTQVDIIHLKQLIVSPGLFILIPAMIITGVSGSILSKQRKGRLVENKQKRMKIIAATGFIILLPSAIMLDQLASSGSFSTFFIMLQLLELLAGASNLLLMGMNMKDGLKLRR